MKFPRTVYVQVDPFRRRRRGRHRALRALDSVSEIEPGRVGVYQLVAIKAAKVNTILQ